MHWTTTRPMLKLVPTLQGLVMTGRPLTEYRQRVKQLGINSLLTKPFSLASLTKIITKQFLPDPQGSADKNAGKTAASHFDSTFDADWSLVRGNQVAGNLSSL